MIAAEQLMGSKGSAASQEIPGSDDRHLLVRMGSRDESALSEFYDRYHRIVYGFALRVIGISSSAEEVVLDVFWNAWNKARDYDPQRGTAFTWLMTMTRSKTIDRLRWEKRERQRQEPIDVVEEQADESVDADERLIAANRGRVVRKALWDLAPEQREVIELAYFFGMTQSEIARHVGLPLGTVKTRVRLGMTKLRTALLPLGEGQEA